MPEAGEFPVLAGASAERSVPVARTPWAGPAVSPGEHFTLPADRQTWRLAVVAVTGWRTPSGQESTYLFQESRSNR